MSIEEKYNIHYFDNKRYYKYDLSSELIVLTDTIPYYFEYKDKRIYESAWNRMTVKILELLDEISPKSKGQLLSFRYSWSNTEVFSKTKRTNFLPFKDIYVNTNHTATHAGMNIQFLLKKYGIDPADCILFIRRHPAAEPSEAREYFKNQNINGFKNYLELIGKKVKSIETIISNFNFINKLLSKGSTGFDDFFLFDDYWYFVNYKIKTLDYVKNHYAGTKNEVVINKNLDLLDNFYRHRDFYLNVNNIMITDEFKDSIEKEIEFLFQHLNSDVISCSKLFARMSMLYSDEMEYLGNYNNASDFYTLIEVIFKDKYYFNNPYISNNDKSILENDDIITNYAYTLSEFNHTIINTYIDKMHLKRLSNYVEFMENCSENYVQVDSDKMVTKDKINSDSYLMEKIKKIVKYYINSFGTINTSTYADYESFPNIGYEWNKYLLVGILRTFFSTDFIVKSTGGTYKTTEYTISLK